MTLTCCTKCKLVVNKELTLKLHFIDIIFKKGFNTKLETAKLNKLDLDLVY
jgi:hypothetical protein